jgi:hypothetical protein
MSMKKKNFKFPKQLLNQISECSNGGYILFNYDGEGKPAIHCGSDSHAHELGLQFFIENYNKAIEAYNIEATLAGMEPPVGLDDDDDDDENEGLR